MIQWVYEQGLADKVYNLIVFGGLIASIIFNLWHCQKYKIGIVKAFFITLIQNIIGVVWMNFYSKLLVGFDSSTTTNAVKMLIFIPLFLYPISLVFKTGWRRTCDFMAPSRALFFGISKFACLFTGCCAGYECAFGIYNPAVKAVCFPAPLLEAFVSLAIMVVLLIIAKRNEYKATGLLMPLLLILFGSTRFFLEFARSGEKLWLGCSDLSFHALFMIIVGIIMYVIIKRKSEIKADEKL